jgi:hypothetical protein
MAAIQFGKNGPGFGGHIKFSQKAISTPADDPLADVDYEDDLEKDSEKELTALQKAYRQRAKNEEARMFDAIDSEYWVCVCFRNRAAKEAYLQAIDAIDIGDKYIDGHALAKRQGVDLGPLG